MLCIVSFSSVSHLFPPSSLFVTHAYTHSYFPHHHPLSPPLSLPPRSLIFHPSRRLLTREHISVSARWRQRAHACGQRWPRAGAAHAASRGAVHQATQVGRGRGLLSVSVLANGCFLQGFWVSASVWFLCYSVVHWVRVCVCDCCSGEWNQLRCWHPALSVAFLFSCVSLLPSSWGFALCTFYMYRTGCPCFPPMPLFHTTSYNRLSYHDTCLLSFSHYLSLFSHTHAHLRYVSLSPPSSLSFSFAFLSHVASNTLEFAQVS